LGLPCSVCRLAPGALVVPSIIDRKFSAVGRGEGEDAAAFGDGSAGAGTSGSFSFTIRAEFSNLSCSELSVSLPISDLRDVFSAVRDSTCVASSSVSTYSQESIKIIQLIYIIRTKSKSSFSSICLRILLHISQLCRKSTFTRTIMHKMVKTTHLFSQP